MSKNRANRPLRSTIIAAFRARKTRLLTTREQLTEDKLRAMMSIGVCLDAELTFMDDDGSMDLADDAVVIIEAPELLSHEIAQLLAQAGYPRDRDAAEIAPFGLEAQSDQVETVDAGYLFCSFTRDPYRRPVLWITGASQKGLLYVTRWLTEAGLKGVPCPESYPGNPVEALIAPYPSTKRVVDRVCLNHLQATIICGDMEFDGATGQWRLRRRLPRVELRYVGETVRAVVMNGMEWTAAQGAKFDLLVVLAEASLAGRWITIDDAATAVFGSGSTPAVAKSHVKCLHARLRDLRDTYTPLVDTRRSAGRSMEYRLNAAVEIMREK